VSDQAATELTELRERLEAVETRMAAINAVTTAAMASLGRPEDLQRRLSQLEERMRDINTLVAEARNGRDPLPFDPARPAKVLPGA
jgi:predicted  nucleic acid-binding Zn-ribbon protein